MYREALCEDESFPERELAALVAAKVYYHLQEYNESMVFALAAGKLFNLDSGDEFEETIICTSLTALVVPSKSAYVPGADYIICSKMRRHLHLDICDAENFSIRKCIQQFLSPQYCIPPNNQWSH